MRRYFTRALALSLAFTLALALLPGAALAAPSTEVWVGGTDVSAGGYWKADGAGTLTACTSVDAWNVHYETATAGNAATATLTLKDARITGAHDAGTRRCGVYAGGDLAIRLLGDSAVGGPALNNLNPGANTSSNGVSVKGELTILGGGSLVSTGGKDTFSYGVSAGDLHMRGGTLMANGGAADWQSAGVIVTDTVGGQQSRLTMEKGRLTGTGGPAAGVTGGMGAFSIGVDAGKITMRGGDLTGTGGRTGMVEQASTSAGVSAAEDIIMEDGRLTGTGGTAGKTSYGVVTTFAGITMKGGRLTGTGGPAGEVSYGVNSGLPSKPNTVLTVLGGEATAQSLGASPTAQAFDKAPAIGPDADARVWYGADEAAALAQGPQAPKDAPADYWREKYAKVYVPVYAPSDAGLTYRTLRDGATGIEARGYFSDGAALSVKEATLHPAGACAACDAIRARQAAGELILLWDISLATGHYSGGIEMRFPVGAKYNGQTLTLLHCRDNMLESQSALVENGMASGMFGGFSPFAVAVGGGAAGIPKTGDGPALWLGLALVALAVGAYGLARRRKA